MFPDDYVELLGIVDPGHLSVKAAYAGGLRVRADGPTIGLPSKRERDAQAKRAKEGNE